MTKREKDTLLAIIDHISHYSYPPTTRELATTLRVKSASTVHGFLEQLRKKGYITWEESRPRTMRVLKEAY